MQNDIEKHIYGVVVAPKISLRYVGIGIAITFCVNSLIGLLFAATYSVFTTKGLVVDLIYSHSIGWLMLVFLMGGRHLLWPRSAPSDLGLFLLAIVGGSAAWVLGNYLGASINGHTPFPQAKLNPSLMIPGLIMTALGAVVGTVYFRNREQVSLLKINAEQQARLAETAHRQLISAQLSTLQAQLEPHMLFNTLANLRALIGVDPSAAQLMLDKLNSFLRATLSSTRQKEIKLGAEFQLVNDYLDLMKIRLGPRLQFELELPEHLRDTPVPPLLLQPLVENAIKHGIEPFSGNGLIRVSAKKHSSTLELKVSDQHISGDESSLEPTVAPANGQGFGLDQLQERLMQIYGDKATFRVQLRSAIKVDSVVEINLPC
jgi:sensor histidine kinase YesM